MRSALLTLLLLGSPMAARHDVHAESQLLTVAAQQAEPKQQDEFVPISQLPAQDQLPAAPLLITAYAFVWCAVFVYVASIARRVSTVQREVARLEADMKKGQRA